MLPVTNKPHFIMSGPLRGRFIVTSWHDYPNAILGRVEPRLLAWFHHNVKAGETWLDIGAHAGYVSIALAQLVGNGGRVFSFEPMVSTAGLLNETRRANRMSQMRVLPVACGNPSGNEEHVFLRSFNGMVDSSNIPASIETSIEGILVVRFDWLWARICGGDPNIHGVKIDVQGMEIECLRGMRESLRAKFPKLIIEVHAGVDREQLMCVLYECGYRKPGLPIEPQQGTGYLDNCSYYFEPEEEG
jgi:FkbM family methyltransferase